MTFPMALAAPVDVGIILSAAARARRLAAARGHWQRPSHGRGRGVGARSAEARHGRPGIAVG